MALTSSSKFVYALSSDNYVSCIRLDGSQLVGRVRVSHQQAEVPSIAFHQGLNLLFAFTSGQEGADMIFLK